MSCVKQELFSQNRLFFFEELTSNKEVAFKQRYKHKLWQLNSLKDYNLNPKVLCTSRKGLDKLS